MAEYIDRQTVLQCIKESRENIDWGQSEDGDAFLHYSAALYRTIASKECLSSADVAPVRHGRWKCGDDMYEYAICSVCGWDSGEPYGYIAEEYGYCPNCGARMDGEL